MGFALSVELAYNGNNNNNNNRLRMISRMLAACLKCTVEHPQEKSCVAHHHHLCESEHSPIATYFTMREWSFKKNCKKRKEAFRKLQSWTPVEKREKNAHTQIYKDKSIFSWAHQFLFQVTFISAQKHENFKRCVVLLQSVFFSFFKYMIK